MKPIKDVNDAIIALSEALFNLREDYPHRDRANRALGHVVGGLGIKFPPSIIHMNDDGSVTVEANAEYGKK